MRAYLVRRLLQFLPVVVLAAFGVWALVFALPGDPVTAMAGEEATKAQLIATRQRLGLDLPVWQQFFIWAGNVLMGDLGTSYTSHVPVGELLGSRLSATLQLVILSMTIGLALALPLGTIAGWRPNSVIGRFVNVYLVTTLAMPAFWIGVLLIIFLSVNLGLFPAASSYESVFTDPAGALHNMLLPATAIGINMSAITARFIAASLYDALSRDFIRTARAKGAGELRVVLRHGLRNALLPVTTILGLQLGSLLGGTIIIEIVFNYPGIGRLIFSAIGSRDYAMLQGAVLFVVAMFLIVNLVVDILYAYLDPRIRYR